MENGKKIEKIIGVQKGPPEIGHVAFVRYRDNTLELVPTLKVAEHDPEVSPRCDQSNLS